MNTIKCRDCKGVVSKRAKTCPHCGAPTTMKESPGVGICVVVLALMGAGIWWITQDKPKATPQVPREPSASAAKATPRQVTPLFDLTAVTGKSTSVVDGLLGKPRRVDPITGSPKVMPGEIRSYVLGAGKHVADVRFFKGEAATITLNIEEGVAISAAETLKLVGVDKDSLSLVFQTPADSPIRARIKRFRGTVSGISFDEISTTGTADGCTLLVAKASGYPQY